MKNIIIILIFCFPVLSLAQPDKNNSLILKSNKVMKEAYAKFEERKLEESLILCNSAIKLNPKNDYAYYLKGTINRFKNLPEEALINYNTAISLNNKDDQYFSDKGDILVQLKMYNEALSSYNQSLLLVKDKFGRSMIYLSRAFLKIEILDWEGALKDINISILNENSYCLTFNKRAEINNELGNYSAAISDANNSLALSIDKNYEAYLQRGIAKANLGQKESACKDLDFAQSIMNEYRVNAAKKKFCN